MHLAAALPADEEERLQALRELGILDTPPEASFDRITAIAARIFRVPISLVSFVDRDRQWFKSSVGLPVCGTSRDVSFCAHSLLVPDEVMVVPDALLDPRFAQNPLVTGPLGIRFYAGVPLLTAQRRPLGSLCLIDLVPRTFSAADCATLQDLGAMVVEMLDLRQALQRAQAEQATREKAEVALRKSENRFRRMTENTPVMIYQFVSRPDGSFYFSYVSDRCQEICGVAPEAIYEDPELILKSLAANDLENFQATAARSAETLQPWNWEGRLDRPDHSTCWVQGISRPERLPNGDILWDGMLLDVTARKNAEQERETSHNLLRAVIDGTDDAVFVKDRESRYVLMNPAGAAFFGCSPTEVVGRADSEFFTPEATRQTRQHDVEIMESRQSQTYEDVDLIAGNSRVFLTTKSPYRDGAGNVLGVIGISRDVSRQRLDAVALREAKEEAERANRAKSDFLSRMSHELGTPLNAILGFGQLLETAGLHSRHHSGVMHILRAGRHLLSLIDEVLALARIEAGKMELLLEPVGVHEISSECLSLISGQAAERGISCQNPELLASQPTHVMADRQRLRQVLLNFLSNAVKYNRVGGQIILSCQAAPHLGLAESRRVRIEITDTGSGLQPEEIKRLFVPFERLNAERGNVEGTGPGLALSKGLVEAMGGRLGVDSVPGQGSTFWVELLQTENSPQRFAGVDDPSEAASGESPCRGTVLYVEDNHSNLQLIECVFAMRPGLELLSVKEGILGLEVAAASQPDLILLDLHLPDLPGAEVLAMLRENPLTADIPVVIISADATPGQINRLQAMGVLDYLTKPIDVAKLLRLLDRQLCAPAEPALAFAGALR